MTLDEKVRSLSRDEILDQLAEVETRLARNNYLDVHERENDLFLSSLLRSELRRRRKQAIEDVVAGEPTSDASPRDVDPKKS